MNRELKNEDADNQNRQRVIKHLETADGLLIILPMTAAVILGFAAAFTERDSSMGMGMGLAAIILGFFFCVAYGFLALILSLLTRRNKTYRFLLVGICLLAAAGFFVSVFL